MEALRKALIADCEETLANSRNRFTKHDPCCCENNLKVAIRTLKTDRSVTERYLHNIEIHIRDKGCTHVWSHDRTSAAVWDVIDTRST